MAQPQSSAADHKPPEAVGHPFGPPTGPLLKDPWGRGGGLFGALASPQPTHPPPHNREIFLRQKVKFIRGAHSTAHESKEERDDANGCVSRQTRTVGAFGKTVLQYTLTPGNTG